VERSVTRAELQKASSAQPAVDERMLPISVLGTGRMGLAEKTQAYIHQVWLEYGPAVDDVRQANRNVRTILSDMGVEFSIGDVKDVVRGCLGQPGPAVPAPAVGQPGPAVPAPAEAEVGHMFPLALVIPGPQHIIDNVLQTSLMVLPSFKDFQVSVKVVSQWLQPVSNRRLLQDQLRARGGALAASAKLLDAGCDRFADWRWKTLDLVTRALLRMRPAAQEAAKLIGSAAEISTRNEGAAGAFLESVKDDHFWETVVWTRRVIKPLVAFSSWIRGCDCHEVERLARKSGNQVSCPWQGCRAAGLARRYLQTLREIDELRGQQCAACPDLDVVLTRMLASLQVKMEWVTEGPYLVWQAADPAVAASMIQQRDAMVAAGQQPHRVSEFFLGEHSQLRADMERHAMGHGLSAELKRELQSYALANIDDTWAEAAHRDDSVFCKRCPASKVPYLIASQRTLGILASLDQLTEEDEASFHSTSGTKLSGRVILLEQTPWWVRGRAPRL